MSEIEIAKSAGILLLGSGIGIGGRIIFDWLKERHNGTIQTSSPAPVDSDGKASQRDCNKKHKEIDGQLRGIDICLVQHKAAIESHEKRLDKGDRDFEAVKKSITGLDKSYAVLASKIK